MLLISSTVTWTWLQQTDPNLSTIFATINTLSCNAYMPETIWNEWNEQIEVPSSETM